MIKATVIIDYARWKKKIKIPEEYIKKKVKKLSTFPLFKKKKYNFTILLTNNKKMKELNKRFRKKDKPTDVLSFPFTQDYKNKIYIGDIAISFQFINKRSSITNFNLEFDKTWIHGYLHLIGYDHKNIKDFKKMSNKENIIFNFLNRKN
tara:strand:+ start:286 stop:732 length:447 start_codon:yes stop_codon:yes gene_type:complete